MKSLLIIAAITTTTSATSLPNNEEFLKKEFLQCDLHASQYMLDDGEGAYCSDVYEKLKNQYFNGSATALLDWWRAAKEAKKSK